jgi:hypothetical protein
VTPAAAAGASPPAETGCVVVKDRLPAVYAASLAPTASVPPGRPWERLVPKVG